MRIYLQWAKRQAEDWQPLEVNNNQVIAQLVKRGVPGPNSVVDDGVGWLCGLNCQGIDFSGYDHTSIEVVGTGLRITGWQDDSEDFGTTRWATEWTLMPPTPDPTLGGGMNTVQGRRVWATPDVAGQFPSSEVQPWEQFVPPPSNLTLHGIWMSEDLYLRHRGVRSSHGWREWLT